MKSEPKMTLESTVVERHHATHLDEMGSEFAKKLLDGPAAEAFNPLSLAETYREELRGFLEAASEVAAKMAELNAATAVMNEYFARQEPLAFDPEMGAMVQTGSDAIVAFLRWTRRASVMTEIFPFFAEYIVKSIDATATRERDIAGMLSAEYRHQAIGATMEVIFKDAGVLKSEEETDGE